MKIKMYNNNQQLMLAIAKTKKNLLAGVIFGGIFDALLIFSCITVFSYSTGEAQYIWDINGHTLLALLALFTLPIVNLLFIISILLTLRNFKQQWKAQLPSSVHKLVKPAIAINILSFIIQLTFFIILFTFAPSA